MSVQEFDQMDNELMAMVNDHANPETVAAAEKLVAQQCAEQQACEEPVRNEGGVKQDWYTQELAGRRRTKVRRSCVQIILCVLIMAALLCVMNIPSLLIWLVNIGVVSCSVVCGIVVDRWIRHGW